MADRAEKKERKGQKAYSGALARPLRTRIGKPTLAEVLSDDAKQIRQRELQEDHARVVTEAMGKLNLLCDHYGIEHGDWFKLAWNLAHAHVPGFRVEDEKASGRPKDWDNVRLLFLWWKVEELRRHNQRRLMSVSEACKRLAGDRDLAKMLCNAKEAKTLQNRYEEASNSPFVLLLRKRTRDHDEIAQIMNDLGPQLFAPLAHE